MSPQETKVAFFDVDETLITIKSMFRFLEHHLDPEEYEIAVTYLRDRAAAGTPREETNREYYRNFIGERATDVAASGQRWFAAEIARGGLFHDPAVAEFQRHRNAGVATVLVSGSFSACLDPIADHLGADLVLSTVPEVLDGIYTGEVTTTVIGAGKAEAAREAMAKYGATPAECVAYGDHASDLPLLLAVGRGVVVGDDPVLLRYADEHGWDRLPGIAIHRVEN